MRIPWYAWPVCVLIFLAAVVEWWVSPDTDRVQDLADR